MYDVRARTSNITISHQLRNNRFEAQTKSKPSQDDSLKPFYGIVYYEIPFQFIHV